MLPGLNARVRREKSKAFLEIVDWDSRGQKVKRLPAWFALHHTSNPLSAIIKCMWPTSTSRHPSFPLLSRLPRPPCLPKLPLTHVHHWITTFRWPYDAYFQLSAIAKNFHTLWHFFFPYLFVVFAGKFSSKPLLEKPSPLMSNLPIPLKTSKPRSKTKKVSHQINNVLFLPVNNWKMAVRCPITTSKRKLPFT